jgi:hypothetical protein
MPRKQTEDIKDESAFKDPVHDMLRGDDFYWHYRVKRVLFEAGF